MFSPGPGNSDYKCSNNWMSFTMFLNLTKMFRYFTVCDTTRISYFHHNQKIPQVISNEIDLEFTDQ